MSEVPKGTVGLVDEKARLAQIEREALKHASSSAKQDGKHHLLSDQEQWEEEQKELKRQQIQERARQRLAEAEKNNPALKEKNPGFGL